jgi:hypothetical protein
VNDNARGDEQASDNKENVEICGRKRATATEQTEQIDSRQIGHEAYRVVIPVQYKRRPRIHRRLTVYQVVDRLVHFTARTARRVVLGGAPTGKDVGGRLARAAKGRVAGGLEHAAVAEEHPGGEGVFEGDVYVGEATHPGAGAGDDAGPE